MGALKLTYYENKSPLKIAYSKADKEAEKIVHRFLSVDPITDQYPELTPYQFASNRPIDGIDLDGLEFFGPLWSLGGRVSPIIEVIKPAAEVGSKVGEVTGETPKTPTTPGTPVSTPRPVINRTAIKNGRTTETEQLAKNGLDKNTESMTVKDPKTGKDVTTIPDATKNGGKSTVEIKNVKKQSLSEQLRAQEKYSNDNGFKPELIINQGAKISEPLQKSSFDIKYYNTTPSMQRDNTNVAPPLIPNKTPPPSTSNWDCELCT